MCARVCAVSKRCGERVSDSPVRLLTKLIWWAVFNKKDLTEVVLFWRQALLVELELTQALRLLMLHGANMLY